jgi:serine-type D-Ala-D-Ala carboxypeptidase/endopeptidase
VTPLQCAPRWVAALCMAAACIVAAAQGVPPDRNPALIAEAVLGPLPGVAAVGVLRNGRAEVAVRRRDGAGQPLQVVSGAEPLFEIGSISKVFTGLLVAQRVEAGGLRLDDSLGNLLEGRVDFRYDTASKITVRQLLTHASCMRRWPAGFTQERMFEQASRLGRDGLWRSMSQLVVARSPPCETMYSNVGYAVLGALLEEREGKPWDTLLAEGVTAPLALHDTRQHLAPAQQARLAPPWRGALRAHAWNANVFAPAGGLRSTAGDLLRFSRALMQGRQGPLGPAAARLVTDLAAFGENGLRIGYGVLLAQSPDRTWLHNGETAGYQAEWVVWPDTGEALVILASNRLAPAGTIRREILAKTWSGPVQEVVYTRGEFRGRFEEDGGRKQFVRVKLAPGQKLPFSTLTFRVLDPKVVQGMAEGSLVEFRAERLAGENTIVEMRLAKP